MSQDKPQEWSRQGYWQGRFERSDTPWELGHPSSALFEAFDALPSAGVGLGSGARVVIPGCGTGSDALELARRGLRVTAIDWSSHALARLKERAQDAGLSGSLAAVAGNFFEVPPQPVDAFAEHTFFCAIDPSQRRAYAERAAQWVRPGGVLFGNFFVLESSQDWQGPPFVSTKESLVRDLSGFFDCLKLEPARRPEPDRRPGMEWIGIFRRTSA